MDYDRYIELYRQGKFQEAVEYKATQVPTRLVKYYSLNDSVTVNKSKLQYLKEQRIFLRQLPDLMIHLRENFLSLIKINWKRVVGIKRW